MPRCQALGRLVSLNRNTSGRPRLTLGWRLRSGAAVLRRRGCSKARHRSPGGLVSGPGKLTAPAGPGGGNPRTGNRAGTIRKKNGDGGTFFRSVVGFHFQGNKIFDYSSTAKTQGRDTSSSSRLRERIPFSGHVGAVIADSGPRKFASL